MEECALKMGWKGKTVTENSSRTTEENMTCSAKIIADSGLQDIVIVTNAFHMPAQCCGHDLSSRIKIFSTLGDWKLTRFAAFLIFSLMRIISGYPAWG